MLRELRVENLGVIAELSLVLGPGMTVVTGETGAGKTLVVEALELVVGARADASLVRQGEDEARAEARFELDDEVRGALASVETTHPIDDELVVTRVIPRDGRSRAYVNGRLVPVSVLAELGRQLVDLHGQHSHHVLLNPAAQRAALDRFAGQAAAAALDEYRRVRREIAGLDSRLAGLGGDERGRAREIDLLRFQLDEIDVAGIVDAGEADELRRQEEVLADAAAHRMAARSAHDALDGRAVDGLGSAVDELSDRDPFRDVAERMRVLQDEVAQLALEVRRIGDGIEDDPLALETVAARRRALRELCRKYGESLADVLGYREEIAQRLRALEGAEDEGRRLESERSEMTEHLRLAAARLSKARASAAARLGETVTGVLRELAMPAATIAVDVVSRPFEAGSGCPEDGFDDVTFLLSANPGEGMAPLARVASGGELARSMLAARVVLSEAPPTLVFDEVDAGIGGQAGVAVGRKLAVVAEAHQVLCVTHLAQVAAFADTHVVVDKAGVGGRTVARARGVEGTDRVAELSRMLSGSGTARARDHAEELLSAASHERVRR